MNLLWKEAYIRMIEVDIKALRDIIATFMKPKRLTHTLGVEEEARALGSIFLPEKLNELSVAGLLHDITKELSVEEHIQLCHEYGITVDFDNIESKLFHAKTGCEFARRKFGCEVVDDEIYYGIYYHTTGREGMTLFESIIYLADYIEKNRTFPDCVKLREYFYNNLEKCDTIEQKKEILRMTMVLSFDMTIKNLIEESRGIDLDTIKARNYFLKNKNCF